MQTEHNSSMFDIVTIWFVSYASICEYFTNIFNVLTTNI